MNPELFQPSLKPGVNYETKSYNLTSYLYACMIGGFLPALVLGMQNAVWLRANPLLRSIILAVGIILYFVLPLGILRFFLGTWIGIAYYFLMERRYKVHKGIHATIQPMLQTAIGCSFVGRMLEVAYIVKGVPLLYGS
ncbi:hypothetical protein HPY27_17600 [Brevibacillus sp. HB1.1]|uniref:hypothetical protein n=1 Tax=Brevibacillus sp. HB1.1 TaxID=2738808 RepID=UPI00037989D5|nr:hypothetical protein [Brevibacillus sp. HB1.1]ATF15339.1 hypothetical protein A616_26305 [Brevibacillus brevis X23]NTU31970.1 hypothetical protein [Brevibacillus sp. HB1.1]